MSLEIQRLTNLGQMQNTYDPISKYLLSWGEDLQQQAAADKAAKAQTDRLAIDDARYNTELARQKLKDAQSTPGTPEYIALQKATLDANKQLHEQRMLTDEIYAAEYAAKTDMADQLKAKKLYEEKFTNATSGGTFIDQKLSNLFKVDEDGIIQSDIQGYMDAEDKYNLANADKNVPAFKDTAEGRNWIKTMEGMFRPETLPELRASIASGVGYREGAISGKADVELARVTEATARATKEDMLRKAIRDAEEKYQDRAIAAQRYVNSGSNSSEDKEKIVKTDLKQVTAADIKDLYPNASEQQMAKILKKVDTYAGNESVITRQDLAKALQVSDSNMLGFGGTSDADIDAALKKIVPTDKETKVQKGGLNQQKVMTVTSGVKQAKADLDKFLSESPEAMANAAIAKITMLRNSAAPKKDTDAKVNTSKVSVKDVIDEVNAKKIKNNSIVKQQNISTPSLIIGAKNKNLVNTDRITAIKQQIEKYDTMKNSSSKIQLEKKLPKLKEELNQLIKVQETNNKKAADKFAIQNKIDTMKKAMVTNTLHPSAKLYLNSKIIELNKQLEQYK